eukprot:TRINITY_DN48387_c0_g1_i1.p1 TRINITY_DN48387_c0_g1~~TRINITY_DN48387_c0_g1_i1.p1  ORF type:complete len:393 (-),score=79.67 TRINITY_DN48387_c0_g1_i1:96-1274(-)
MNASIPGRYGFRRRSEQRQVALDLVWSRTSALVEAELVKADSPTEIASQDQVASASASAAPPPVAIDIDWPSLPPGLDPAEGELDAARTARKRAQVSSLASYALALIEPGSHVVEFGAGTGHLGLLLAYLRPAAKVVLVEMKTYASSRARERVEAARSLGVTNCEVFQGTVDDFADTGRALDVVVGLHTCGLLADAIFSLAVERGSAACVCPCCYGQLASVKEEHQRGQGTFARMHPCSKAFITALSGGSNQGDCMDGSNAVSVGEEAHGVASEIAGTFVVDAVADDGEASCRAAATTPSPPPPPPAQPVHGDGIAAFSWCAKAADFTAGRGGEFDTNAVGFRTALRCMQTVDADRINFARERGYGGSLGVLEPLGCSPKCSVVRLVPPRRS